MSKSYTCQNPSNTDYTAIITLSVIIIISSRTASYSWLETLLFPYNTKAGIPAYISLLRPSSRLPSDFIGRHSLITVTSSYRICTCFPFHRSQIHIACHKSDSNACLLRHLYATYSVSSCVAYAIASIIILQLVTLFNRFLSDALQTHLQKRCKKLQNTLQQPACK